MFKSSIFLAARIRPTYVFNPQYITHLQLKKTPPNFRFQRLSYSMATPYQIKISPSQTGLLKVEQREKSAEKATELLQKDLEVHTLTFIPLHEQKKHV
jgi:hypothetical protein